jgi:hypothetical protein
MQCPPPELRRLRAAVFAATKTVKENRRQAFSVCGRIGWFGERFRPAADSCRLHPRRRPDKRREVADSSREKRADSLCFVPVLCFNPFDKPSGYRYNYLV